MTASDFIWQIVAIGLFGILGATVCRRRAHNLPAANFHRLLERSPHLYLAPLPLVLMPMANVFLASRPSLQWDMPVWMQLHWAALSWGIVAAVLAYVFGFCAIASRVTRQRGRVALVVFGIFVLTIIEAYAGWSSRPNLPPMTAARISDDGVIMQTTPFTCVPAAGANIAAMLGVQTTEGILAQLCHTTRDGTLPAQALQGMKKLGIDGRKSNAGANINAVQAPAMLFISHDTHAVVYAGMKDGGYEIWNPNTGKVVVPEWWLRKFWNGHALEFYRSRD